MNATGPHFVILAEAGIQRGRVAPTTPDLQRPGLIFIPWCGGASRHERLVRKSALQLLMAERENVARGLVPRWGRGGAWQNPPCQLAIPNHNSGFSYLGAPAPAGMGDCYESMSRTTIRDRLPPPTSSFQRSKARPVGRTWNPEGEGQDRHTIGENPAAHKSPHVARPW